MNQLSNTISATKFKQIIETGSQPQVIDVRTDAEVANLFLEGSAHFPLQNLNCADVKTYLREQDHDPEHPVYLLCASGQRASRAAEQLQGELNCPLVIIEGGISALNTAGISIQKGAGNTISLERQVRIVSGCLIVLSVILGSLVNPWFYAIAAFVGAGLALAGITNSCALAMLLARMPWNRAN